MQHERCVIRAFTKDIWKELLDSVNVSQAVRNQLLDAYGTITDGNDRSRDDEDRLIQKDLDHVRDNP